MSNNLVNIPVAVPPVNVPIVPGTPIPPGTAIPLSSIAGMTRPQFSPVSTRMTASSQIGVFITAQSLVTFPVASSIVTTIWKFSLSMIPALATNTRKNWALLVVSLIVGVLIYYLSEPEGQDQKTKIKGLAIALINSLVLAAAAIGIDEVTAQPPITPVSRTGAASTP